MHKEQINKKALLSVTVVLIRSSVVISRKQKFTLAGAIILALVAAVINTLTLESELDRLVKDAQAEEYPIFLSANDDIGDSVALAPTQFSEEPISTGGANIDVHP